MCSNRWFEVFIKNSGFEVQDTANCTFSVLSQVLLGVCYLAMLRGITEYLLFDLRNTLAWKRWRHALNYGGEISVSECWETLSNSSKAVLIDVRTNAEWAYVGMPELTATMTPLVGQQWQLFPTMEADPDFTGKLITTLKQMQLGDDTKLFFLCRSGVRSLAAARAMWGLGYKESFNITGGFEGDPDDNGHRGQKNGWKADGLPWRQN